MLDRLLGRDQAPKTDHVSVRDHGASGDGSTDDTDSFNAAIAAAEAAGHRLVFVPKGTYRIRYSSPRDFNSILLTPGCHLVGAGSSDTVIQAMTDTADPQWPAFRLIWVETDGQLTGLTIDGDRSGFDPKRFKGTAATLVATRPDAANLLFEDLHIRGQFSNGREGFGLAVGAVTNTDIRNVEAYDNDGSGIAISSSNPWEVRPNGVRVEDIRVYRNGRQGFTTYGASSVTVSKAVAYENLRHGLNVEWSDDITFVDCESRGNERRGLRVAGNSQRIRFERVKSVDNGRNYEKGAELILTRQVFSTPNPSTGQLEAGYPKDVEVIDSEFQPADGRPHLMANPIFDGSQTPEIAFSALRIEGSNSEQWKTEIIDEDDRLGAEGRDESGMTPALRQLPQRKGIGRSANPKTARSRNPKDGGAGSGETVRPGRAPRSPKVR